MKNKSYSECISLPTFEDRFKYLKCQGSVGSDKFGHLRYLEQKLYHSPEWLSFKRSIIIRDEGNDLAISGLTIYDRITIHHINPLSIDDIINLRNCVFDPENVICTSFSTHNAIHYSDDSFLLKTQIIERKPNDTKLW